MRTAARRRVAFVAVLLSAIAGQSLGMLAAFVTLRAWLGTHPFEDSSQLTPIVWLVGLGGGCMAGTVVGLRLLVRARVLTSAEARRFPDFLRGARIPRL